MLVEAEQNTFRCRMKIKVPRKYQVPSDLQVPSEDQVPSKYQVPSDLQVPSDVQMPSISKIVKWKLSNTVGPEHQYLQQYFQ